MILYHLFTTLAVVAVIPVFTAYSLITGSKRRGLRHHFGLVPAIPREGGRKTVWLYALSRGEVVAAAPVLKRLREQRPDLRLAVSVTTDSGYDAARQYLAFADRVFFHPFDCLPFNLTALGRIRPDVFVLTETGLWPGLPSLLERRGNPLLLFHGRISEKSLRRYRRVKAWASLLLNRFDLLCMQNERGLRDFKSLGVEEARLRLIGDTKYDALKTVSEEDRQRLRKTLDIPPDFTVIVAGSTHEGEEEVLLESFRNLRETHPSLVLIVAPRRLERIPALRRLFEEKAIGCIPRTGIGSGGRQGKPVILLDTMGELLDIYSTAEITFVGNSLFPPGGGHSLIEPAAQGKVVLHGPWLDYKQDDAEALARLGVAVPVHDARDLERKIRETLTDPQFPHGFAQKAQDWIETKKGASRLMAEIILETLDGKSSQ